MGDRFLLLGLGVFFFLGCGGNVSVEGSTGGQGGSQSSNSSVSASAGGGSGAGGAEAVCGGKQGLPCPATQWCQYPADSVCGCCDLTGVCVDKPLDCGFECPGVCGCDGVSYCNECLANLAGVGVSPDAQCAPPPGYQVHVLPTNAPRFVIFRTDSSTCTRVMAAGFGGPGPYMVEVTPDWQIETIEITDTPDDCKLDGSGFPVKPAKDSVAASTAEGKVILDMAQLPCGVTADMVLTFPPDAGWAPATLVFDSGYLKTQIPCDL